MSEVTSKERLGPENTVAVIIAPPLTESFELSVARAVDLKRLDENIQVLVCSGAVSGCVSNIFQVQSICKHCIHVRQEALGNYFSSEECITLDDYYDSSTIEPMLNDHTVRQVAEKSAHSTLLTFYRVGLERLEGKGLRAKLYGQALNNLAAYSEYIYHCLNSYQKSQGIKRIEFFNGRLIPTSSARQLAENTKIPYTVIEVSGQHKTLFLAEGSAVHELDFQKQSLATYTGSDRFDEALGRRFFEFRRLGKSTNTKSYTDRQRLGLLGHLVDKRIFAIYLNSLDEFEFLGEQWFTPASRDPAAFILELRDLMDEEYAVVVRMHPNQAGDRTGVTSDLIERLSNQRGIELVLPLGRVSTYELLDMAFCNLSFGTTVGVEATYWGKNSLLAGHAVWEEAGVAVNVRTPQDIIDYLQFTRKPLDQLNAVKVGAYFMDKQQASSSLGWGEGNQYGFLIDGVSYLSCKRKSLFYVLNRLIDKFLKYFL